MQFDAHPKVAGSSSELITLDSSPEPEIKDDAQTTSQNLLGKSPEFTFEHFSNRLIPWVRAEGNLPFILGEAHGAPLLGQSPCECGLSRSR